MKMINNHLNPNLVLLTAIEIAGWQIPSIASKTKPRCTAKLPALQRSAVWKPKQIEMLWDSLLRGFPVGSFLLAPFQRDLKKQDFLYERHAQKTLEDPDYHLLDGQQRCNSIALGFLDSWDSNDQQPAALWIDLDDKGVPDEREFVFRVLTMSHPWGYQRKDPSKPLEYKNRRKALYLYTKAFELSKKQTNSNFSFGNTNLVRHAWPWEASCPVPFSLLVEAIKIDPSKAWVVLEKLMADRLPYWNSINNLDKSIEATEFSWVNNVKKLLEKPNDLMRKIVDSTSGALIGGVGNVPFQIPALVLQNVVTDSPLINTTSGNESKDPIETLFIRINSAGTPLQGEELNYSILKSIWPDAQCAVESLETKIMVPSRLIALISRLVLARTLRNDDDPPAALDVSRFRRLVHGRDAQCPTFLVDIQNYLSDERGPGKKLLILAKQILTLGDSKDSRFRLPVAITADIARSSPEIFFILLVWLDRLIELKIDPLSLDDDILRRIVGSVTALSWFGEEHVLCVKILWKRLQECEDSNLIHFLSYGSLKDCLEVYDNGKIPLVPLLPPEYLKESVEKSLYGLSKGSRNTWQNWKWWDHFNGVLPKSESAKKWYARKVKEDSGEIEYQLEAWTKFTNILWGKKEIVLYAQREWLIKWFSNFDPTSSDQVEDTDRPWDFDHIHPQKYIYGRWNIPQVIKDWHGSIGNFRAWPFELNRGDAEEAPRIKLKDAGDVNNHFYLKKNNDQNAVDRNLLNASFINQRVDWPLWNDCAPQGDFHANYLAKADEYGDCRVALIHAITKRWVALYRLWYSELLIKDLFK